MRQSDLLFSNILTKIGNGDALDPDQKALIESRFRSRDWCHKNVPNAIRLFHKNVDVDTYNASTANPRCHSIASDAYTGHRDQAQLNTARTHTHKMSIVKSGNMPYNLPLCLEQPYMITTNVNIEDGIVNGAIGQLKHIDFKSATEPDADDPTPTNSTTTPIVVDGVPYCLWLEFQENTRIGNMARVKHRPMLITRKELRQTWTPIFKKTTTFPVSNNKTIKCRRTNFPLCQASAITTHKSQGATFDHVVFDYNRGLQQQLVYVALSRVRTIEGLFMTNPNNDFKFHHAKPATSPMLLSLQNELRRLTTHPLITIDHLAQLEMEKHTTILLNFNVQSLAAHVRDITTDTILMQATIYCLTETWLKNEHEIAIPGLQLMSQNKRPVRAGGVAIYVRTNSAPQDALRQQPQLTSDDCGDICSACTTIDGNLTQIVCIYINTSTSIEDIKNFLLKHTAIIGSTTHENHERPLILAGDFNCDMRIATNKMVLTAFMKHRFNLDLITNTDKPTTKNNTCIDLTFTRKVPHGPIFTNISYFSYHHPSILCLQ